MGYRIQETGERTRDIAALGRYLEQKERSRGRLRVGMEARERGEKNWRKRVGEND